MSRHDGLISFIVSVDLLWLYFFEPLFRKLFSNFYIFIPAFLNASVSVFAVLEAVTISSGNTRVEKPLSLMQIWL